MSEIEVDGVTKYFGPTHAVGPVSLTVKPGELLSLLGPSGCGKTTTLRMIAGFEEPSGGTIRIGGRVANDVPVERRGVGMVFQSYALFPHLSVFENVAFGLRLRRTPEAELVARTNEALALVGLGDLGRRMPKQLSGGQQQRVSLARALAVRPAVLLLDEPLSNLDLKLREQMRDEIRRLQRRLGITAIYVTHDQGEAMAMSDRIAVMNQGRVEQVGAPREIYEQPASLFVAGFIGQCSVLAGRLDAVTAQGARFVTRAGTAFTVSPALIRPGWRPGRSLALVIRPEAVLIGAAAAVAESRHQAAVEEVVYLGDRASITLRLRPGGEPILAAERVMCGRPLPRVGDELPVGILPGDCSLVDDAAAAAS